MGVHFMTVDVRRVWKVAISSLLIEVGSGRRRPAANVAFAMASWWEAIVMSATFYCVFLLDDVASC